MRIRMNDSRERTVDNLKDDPESREGQQLKIYAGAAVISFLAAIYITFLTSEMKTAAVAGAAVFLGLLTLVFAPRLSGGLSDGE